MQWYCVEKYMVLIGKEIELSEVLEDFREEIPK